MKARIIRIGNSQGVRIPKPLLEQAGLSGEVELRVEPEGLLVAAISAARDGWADAARLLHERGDDGLLDESPATEFEESEWQW